MQVLPHTRSCFVCGESNALGLRMRFHSDGQIVRAEFVPRAEHIGFKDTVHGGIIAAVLDEIMVWACAVQTKQFGYCADLNVRFQQPLRPGGRAIATAQLVVNRRNRLFEARGELRNEENAVLASATGKYLPIKPAEAGELMRELIGESQFLRID